MHVLEEHGELVAAQTGDGVLTANAEQQAFGRGDQQRIARGVSEGVVDGLEVVQVEEEHGHAALASADHRVLEAFGEQRSVGEARQRVVEGAVLELLLGRTQLAHTFQSAVDVATRQVAEQQ